MNVGKTMFAQIMDFVPWTSFERIVQRYGGNSGVRRLTCVGQFHAMVFAQITWRERLCAIEATLSSLNDVVNVSNITKKVIQVGGRCGIVFPALLQDVNGFLHPEWVAVLISTPPPPPPRKNCALSHGCWQQACRSVAVPALKIM